MPDDQPIDSGAGAALAPEIDHKDAAKLAAEGTKDSGTIERKAAAFFLAVVKLLAPGIRIVASNANVSIRC